MARGPYYKPEEKRRLKRFIIEFDGMKTFPEIAEFAQSVGVCDDRDRDALSKYLARLARQMKEEECIAEEDCGDEEKEPVDEDALIINELETLLEEHKKRYEGIMHAILDNATLFEEYGSLRLQYRDIIHWMYENEPARVRGKVESLKKNKDEDEKQRTN